MGYKQYHVYILTNRWRSVLYTGIRSALEKRIWQHQNKAVPGFTKTYNCDRLVLFETYDEVQQAIAREKQIKGWLRSKKIALIAAMNPEWIDLASDWFKSSSGGDPSLRSG